ncbi:MAG: signal peptidase I [Ruminococcus sp.]|nr:signal peptidase I [Ruminococcus sp.]
MKKVIKKAKSIINVLLLVVIAVLAISIMMSLVARINGTAPEFFGYSIFRVSSGSMEPELMVGDVILSESTVDINGIKPGDIVTYRGSGNLSGKLITHKVITAPYEEEGETFLQTKGTANEVADTPISADRVESVMICKLTFLNKFYDFFFSSWGLLAMVALIIFVFVDELIVFIKTVTGNQSMKNRESINEIIERLQAEEAEQNKEKSNKNE